MVRVPQFSRLGVVAVTVGLTGVGGFAAPAVDGGPMGMAVGVSSAAAATRAGPVDRAVAYVQSAQRRDGGFAPRPKAAKSDPVTSVWAALGLAAVGINPDDQPRRGTTLLTYLTRHADALQDTGDAARLLLVLRAAGEADGKAATATAARILARQRDDGGFPVRSGGTPSVPATAFVALALAGFGGDDAVRPALDRASAWLLEARSGTGWGNAPQGPARAETTGLVLQAIQAVDPEQYEAATAGQSFLAAHGNADGGLSGDRAGRSDARATAWAMQGLYATGVDPRTYETVGGGTPGAYLTKQQRDDGGFGSIRRTAEILPGLNGTPFPLSRVAAGSRRASQRAHDPRAKTTHAGDGAGGAGVLSRARAGSAGRSPGATASSGSGQATTAGNGSGTTSPAPGASASPVPSAAAAPPATAGPSPAPRASSPAPKKQRPPTAPASSPGTTVDGVVVGTQGAPAAAPGIAGSGAADAGTDGLLLLGAAALALFALGSQLERRRPGRVLS